MQSTLIKTVGNNINLGIRSCDIGDISCKIIVMVLSFNMDELCWWVLQSYKHYKVTTHKTLCTTL